MELKKYKLGDIAEVTTGFPFDGNLYSNNGIRVVRGENIGNGEMHWDKRIDKRWEGSLSNLSKYYLFKGDIVMQMDGNVGKNISIILSEEPMLIAQRVACIRAKHLDNQKFVYHILRSKYFNTYIKNNATGTSVKHISLQQIKDFSIPLPNRNWKQIGNLLSSLDQKIALNRKINDNLEAMAKQLYDYWFVQFDFPNEEGKPYKSSGGKMVWNEKLKREIPEGWSDGCFSDIANITMGQSPNGSSYNEDGEGEIFYQGSTDFGIRFPSVRMYTTAPNRFAKQGDILMSVRAPVGAVNIANTDCCIGRGLSAINSKIGSMTYIYFVIHYLKVRFDSLNSAGTTFGSITKDDLYGLPIVIPSSDVIKMYESISKPIFDKQMNIGQEIENLTKQRDELLPLLINGQVSVNYD